MVTDPPAGELDGIAAEVERQLAHLVAIRIHACIGALHNDLELDLADLGHRREESSGLMEDGGQVDGLAGEPKCPGVESVQIEHRLDQTGEPLALLVDDRQEVHDLGVGQLTLP